MEKTVAGARHLFGVGTVTRFHGMDLGDFVVLARDGVVSDLSLLWGVSKQRVRFLLAQGRVLGVEKDCETGQWLRTGAAIEVRPGRRGPQFGRKAR